MKVNECQQAKIKGHESQKTKHIYIHAYRSTYMHTYMHSKIRMYVHAYHLGGLSYRAMRHRPQKEDRTGPDVLTPGTGRDIIPRPVLK